MMNHIDHSLYVIVDPSAAKGRDLVWLAREAAHGGATLIQYRDKHSGGRAMVAQARAIVAALAGTGVPLLVNDRVDVALAAGAQGVHLGQDDMQPADARLLLCPEAILGRTVKNADDAQALHDEPVDYACIGGVFATPTKNNPDPPVGLDGLRRLRALVASARPGLATGAIAGIHAGNAADVIAAGADGIAVVSAVIGAPAPAAAARDLMEIVRAARKAAGLFTGEPA